MSKTMRLTDNAYNQFKTFLFLIFPICSCLVFVASYVWDLLLAKHVMGIISFISLFLGICLTISTKHYRISDAAYDGQILITETDDKKLFSIEIAEDPDDLDKKEFAVFKMVVIEPSLKN